MGAGKYFPDNNQKYATNGCPMCDCCYGFFKQKFIEDNLNDEDKLYLKATDPCWQNVSCDCQGKSYDPPVKKDLCDVMREGSKCTNAGGCFDSTQTVKSPIVSEVINLRNKIKWIKDGDNYIFKYPKEHLIVCEPSMCQNLDAWKDKANAFTFPQFNGIGDFDISDLIENGLLKAESQDVNCYCNYGTTAPGPSPQEKCFICVQRNPFDPVGPPQGAKNCDPWSVCPCQVDNTECSSTPDGSGTDDGPDGGTDDAPDGGTGDGPIDYFDIGNIGIAGLEHQISMISLLDLLEDLEKVDKNQDIQNIDNRLYFIHSSSISENNE